MIRSPILKGVATMFFLSVNGGESSPPDFIDHVALKAG
jgi:hypothetical protein